MNKLLLNIFLIITLNVFGTGLESSISGNIKGVEGGNYNNKKVELVIVRDFITNTPETISKGFTDAFGNFDLKFNNFSTHFAIIKLGKVERTIFIEPSSNYYITIRAALKKLNKSNGFFAKDLRKALIKNISATELNYLIDTLDVTCSDFLANNPFKRKNYKHILNFTDSIQAVYKTIDNAYFQKYLKFKTAELNMYVMRTYRDEFIKKHISTAEDFSGNIQSMHVFNAFFKGIVKHTILSNDVSPFHKYMNRTDLVMMLDEVNPKTANNRELNELILMKGIQEISNVYYYRKSKLTATLDKIIETTAYPLHKIIAKNIKGEINHLEVGSKAPEIAIEYENTNFNLQDYKGKYVYLAFFRSWDTTFEKELEIIDYLKQRYKDDLTVVCISTDIEKSEYARFLINKKKTEHIFHYNFKAQLLVDYQIADFRVQKSHWQTPATYFLIDPKGDIVYNYAKAPSKGFEYDFRLIIGK